MSGPTRVDGVREVLWPSQGRAGWSVYAVLDGARSDRIRAAVTGSGLPHACLYAGPIPAPLVEVAPYLVQLSPEAPFTRTLLADGWGDAWGIFVLANATLEELRRHFRRFLEVRDQRGRTLLFRYYDPRVLRAYLPTCTAGELGVVFGPVAMFVVEGADPARALRFHRDGHGLGAEEVAI